jgi:BrnA antitoxin of type II toxin-antitoxin system
MYVSRENTETVWVDPDDAPELDDDWFDRANLMIGDIVIRRGRPKGSDKKQISLRVDKAVIEAFRAQGPGWQSRINETLRKAVGI